MLKSDFFENLRHGFAYVAQNAEHVQIDEARLKDYANDVAAYPLPETFDDTHHYVSGDAEADYAYVLLLDSVNFGSGYNPSLRAEGTLEEGKGFYFTMASRLKDRFEQKPLTAQETLSLTKADVSEIFGLVAAPKSQELAQLYLEAMQDMAQAVAQKGDFSDFVQAMNKDVGVCVAMLVNQHKFKDESSYKGRTIGFYKRAQITAADLHLTAEHRGEKLFDNIEQLTLFADNAVPHVLYREGVLNYTKELAAKIEAVEYLPLGSAEEVEIRGCAAHAVELLAKETGLRSMDVDHRLWHRSEEPAMKALQTHRTYSIYY